MDNHEDLQNMLQKAMSVEHEKEITSISNLQGFSVGLVALLLQKGILAPEDVIIWEELATSATQAIEAFLRIDTQTLSHLKDDPDARQLLLEANETLARLFKWDEKKRQELPTKLEKLLGGLE